jgi:uncharacterized lipoprotein YddW (UPF0748 family)
VSKLNEMRRFYIFLLLLPFIAITYAQPATGNAKATSSLDALLSFGTPKYEARAVWLTTIGGLDWPHSYSQSPRSMARQQQELRDILDQLAKANINTVILQTRIRGTMIYPSEYEPWDGCLSGFPGRSPGYDALAFAIDECHKRGMEIHAWVVTMPVGKWNKLGCRTLRKRFPGLIRRIGDEGYMNPEDARTGDYLTKICREITHNYDIDGINLDYIRYPETWKRRVSEAQGREYITSIVRKIHDAVKSEKPWVKMSCSPIGKFSDLPRYWSHGWNAYSRVCQDAQAWLKEDLMDELFPMMYFKDEQFYPFALDWAEQSDKKIIAPGLGIYFLDPKEGNWRLGDITREMYQSRLYHIGQAFFRSKFLTDNVQGIYDFSSKTFNRYPSLVPPMTWEKTVPTDTTYNIYVSPETPVDIDDARNLIAARLPKPQMEDYCKKLGNHYYKVVAMDRFGREIRTPEKQDAGPFLSVPLLRCDGSRLQLPDQKMYDADVLVIKTLEGQIVTSEKWSGRTLDVRRIPNGMYTLHSLNRKGVTHRIGTFVLNHSQY